MIVNAPLQFPQDIAYKILGETTINRHLAQLLTQCCPRSHFLGFDDTFEPHRPYRTVFADFHRTDDIAQLEEFRGHDEGVIVMPLPLHDFWTWWTFSQLALPHIAFEPDVSIETDRFIDYIVDVQRGTRGEKGELQVGRGQYFIGNRMAMDKAKTTIAAVTNRLSNLRSVKLYINTLFGEPEAAWSHYVKSAFRSAQYMDYVNYAQCRTVINGGVAGGVELPYFLFNCPADATVFDFDPFGHHYLKPYVKNILSPHQARFVEVAEAIEDHDGTTQMPQFADGQARAADLHPDISGDDLLELKCTTLDSFVARNGIDKVDFIKLDLEGCEPSALVGMEQTIIEHRPQLAISIYHSFDHYWHLPNWLIERCPDYEFFIDMYSFERFEMVFYAIPKEIGARPSFRDVQR